MKLLFLFLIIIVPKISIAQVHVGNGGEGVLTDTGELVLRDLYESKNSNYQIGLEINYNLYQQILKTKLPSFGISPELFARKLNDLEKLHYGLGALTLYALSKYSISFINQDLPLLLDDSNLPNSRRVQIAIRRYLDIAISKNAFYRLSQKQRIALLVHEGLFTLLKLQCNSENVCEQSAKKIRELIGNLFSNPDKSADINYKFLEKYLSIPEYNETCSNYIFSGSINVWSHDKSYQFIPDKILFTEKFNISTEDSTIILNKKIESFCMNAASELISAPQSYFISLEGQKIFLTGLSKIYTANFGQQLSLSITQSSSPIKKFSDQNKYKSCEFQISELIKKNILISKKFFSLKKFCGINKD